MSKKAKEFIHDYTKGCSNELIGGGHHEWLTPEQCFRAVELAEEEFMENTLQWLKDTLYGIKFVGVIDVCDDFIKTMKKIREDN